MSTLYGVSSASFMRTKIANWLLNFKTVMGIIAQKEITHVFEDKMTKY